MMRTAVVSMCSPIGGRSFVTVSSTASTLAADGDLGDAVGQPLEQHVLVLPHDGGDAVGDVAIVHGVGGLVATTRVVQIDLECEIDAEGLWDLPLVRQRPDDRGHGEAVDLDPVAHHHLLSPDAARCACDAGHNPPLW